MCIGNLRFMGHCGDHSRERRGDRESTRREVPRRVETEQRPVPVIKVPEPEKKREPALV